MKNVLFRHWLLVSVVLFGLIAVSPYAANQLLAVTHTVTCPICSSDDTYVKPSASELSGGVKYRWLSVHCLRCGGDSMTQDFRPRP
jgi:hypothetical protein